MRPSSRPGCPAMGGRIEASTPWFRSIMRDQLLARRGAIDAALEGLAAYEFGPGQGYGLRDYWRKRHESEQPRR